MNSMHMQMTKAWMLGKHWGGMLTKDSQSICQRVRSAAVAILSLPMVSGCTTSDPAESSARRVVMAAIQAAKHPATWGPFSAGVAIGITPLDEDLSNWAADSQPLFGNTEAAADASDSLRASLLLGMATSNILAPLQAEEDMNLALSRRLSANGAAHFANRQATDKLKATIGRERPNQDDDRSLPSGHSSSAFSAATMIDLNLSDAKLHPNRRLAARAGLYGVAGMTAWARLEAQKHYPSDVLIGAALGNFMVRFLYATITDPSIDLPTMVEISPDQIVVRFGQSF